MTQRKYTKYVSARLTSKEAEAFTRYSNRVDVPKSRIVRGMVRQILKKEAQAEEMRRIIG